MKALIVYILQCTKRDKIFLSILVCIFTSFLLACFLGSTAAYEQNQMKIVYSSGIFRLILVYGFSIFNTFYISRMFQTRELETFLAGPIARHSLIISLITVNCLLIFSLTAFASLLLKVFFYNTVPFSNLLFWCISVFFETLIISIISIFFSVMIANTTTSILLVTIFYITSRIMGFILSSIELKIQGLSFIGIIQTALIPLSVFFPRLDLFSQSTWLIYSDPISNGIIIILQSLIYIPLLTFACIVDFNKKSL